MLTLVYLGNYKDVDLVVLGVMGGIHLGGTVAQLYHWSREHVQLKFRYLLYLIDALKLQKIFWGNA